MDPQFVCDGEAIIYVYLCGCSAAPYQLRRLWWAESEEAEKNESNGSYKS